MQTYGEAQPRAPFAPASESRHAYPHGRDLAARLMAMDPIDDATARQMKKDAQDIRRKQVREHDYACFA